MNDAILLSGGMDSLALLYWKRPRHAITIDYGQAPAETEIRSSRVACQALGIQHHIVRVDCSSLGSGDLLNQKSIDNSPSSEWWPYRNQMLVTFACMKGIALGVKELYVGSVKSDGFHKDGTKEFYELLAQAIEYQEGGIKVSSPAINFTTSQLVLHSKIPHELLFWAHSCHVSNVACGKCRGCNKYSQVMRELNLLSDE
jgi:7-cyano-7-deazaguanine synthase